jgi:hypothetical protein
MKYSPMMWSCDSGSRWWMSATRPAMVFSIGIIARSDFALSKRVERILEGGAGQRLQIREHVTAGHVRVGAILALKGDAIGVNRSLDWSVLNAAHLAGRNDLPRTLKIGGSIDTQGNRVNDCHIDAHAILKRAKLFKRFAFFKRRGSEARQSARAPSAARHRARYGDKAGHRHRVRWRG